MGYWKAGCPRDVDVALVRIGALNAPGYAVTLSHVRSCRWCQMRIENGTGRMNVPPPNTHARHSGLLIGIVLGFIAFIAALVYALA